MDYKQITRDYRKLQRDLDKALRKLSCIERYLALENWRYEIGKNERKCNRHDESVVKVPTVTQPEPILLHGERVDSVVEQVKDTGGDNLNGPATFDCGGTLSGGNA